MVDLKTLSERILAGLLVEKPAYCLAADRSNKRGFVGQIGPDRPVILNRIRRSNSGGRSGHFGADQSLNWFGYKFEGSYANLPTKSENMPEAALPAPSPVSKAEAAPRVNLNETAFFYPQLETDANGEIIVKFQVPEAISTWKMLGFAHTKDLRFGQISKELVVTPSP